MTVFFIKYCRNLLFLIWIPSIGITQSSNIGKPPIHHFDKEDHKGSAQSWDIEQDHQGIMYFANNAGLLVFDGTYWQCYKVKNQTKVRSVAVASDGKIFVGAEGEIGYFSPNKQGVLTYTLLNSLVPEKDKQFADVWDIVVHGKQVFFRTGNHIFLYNGQSIRTILKGTSLNYLVKIEYDILAYDYERGLFQFEKNQFIPYHDKATFLKKDISGILPFRGDTLMINTLQEGIFLCTPSEVRSWNIDASEALSRGRIYCSVKTDENTFIVGTSTNGVFFLNNKGQVTQHINQQSGLQVNNVLNLFIDNFQNLWVGLDNGIDYLEISSPFSYIYPREGLKATGYATKIHNGLIYFGTSDGLYYNTWRSYYNPLASKPFELVKNSEGQVWSLSKYQDDLFLNHHNGVFIVDDELAKPIFSKNGTWMQLSVGINKLLTGHYKGLLLLEQQGDWDTTFNFQNAWNESSRIMVQDERGYVWVSHPYRGIFKIIFEEDFSAIKKVEEYNSENGLPSDLQLSVFKIEEETVFCTEHGIYTYDDAKDRFAPNKKWNEIIGEEVLVKRLIQAPNGDIWYVTAKEVGLLNVKNSGVYKTIEKRVFPQLADDLVDNFEHIYPHDDENVFIASEDCFIHYNPKKIATDSNFNVFIRLVQLMKSDSILYAGNGIKKMENNYINYNQNALRFRFSAGFYANSDRNQFQFYLEGYDDKWSTWSSKSEVEYMNLKAGGYIFYVRGKNINGILSETTSYNFTIAPPWYDTTFAKIIYGVLGMAIIFFLLFIPQKRFEEEKAALQTEKEQVLQLKEQEKQEAAIQHQQEIDQLEREKLELQIQAKNQELASNTMHIVQKSKMLQTIKNDIQKITKLSTEPPVIKELRKVVRKVSADEHLDQDWEQFAHHFDQVHGQFLQRLRKKYPQLTPNDHRLCAYLRINLSSKEIAPLMNISVRSVEVARYRLRKKLGIEGDVNLVGFLLEV